MQWKPLDHSHFGVAPGFGPTGIIYNRTCVDCTARKNAGKAKTRAEKSKSNPGEPNNAKEKGDNVSQFAGLDVLSLDDFVAKLSAPNQDKVRTAIVKLPMATNNARKHADALSKVIWDTLGYRFEYVIRLKVPDHESIVDIRAVTTTREHRSPPSRTTAHSSCCVRRSQTKLQIRKNNATRTWGEMVLLG